MLLPLQFFTASDPAFTAMVQRWAADGAVARWHGPVGRLQDGAFTPDDGQERWIAPGGMRALAQYLAGAARRGGDLEREQLGVLQRAAGLGACCTTDLQVLEQCWTVAAMALRACCPTAPHVRRAGGGAAAAVGLDCSPHC